MGAVPPLDGLVEAMVAAARTSLEKDWPKARDHAPPEFARLLQSALDIGALATEQKVTPDEARSLFEIHKNTTRMVLLTVRGLELVAVENAVNAALGAVRDTVNGALGFAIV